LLLSALFFSLCFILLCSYLDLSSLSASLSAFCSVLSVDPQSAERQEIQSRGERAKEREREMADRERERVI